MQTSVKAAGNASTFMRLEEKMAGKKRPATLERAETRERSCKVNPKGKMPAFQGQKGEDAAVSSLAAQKAAVGFRFSSRKKHSGPGSQGFLGLVWGIRQFRPSPFYQKRQRWPVTT